MASVAQRVLFAYQGTLNELLDCEEEELSEVQLVKLCNDSVQLTALTQQFNEHLCNNQIITAETP
jgi:hypothetical protein